jgi:membrane protease YdiL (CAAX protease family)
MHRLFLVKDMKMVNSSSAQAALPTRTAGLFRVDLQAVNWKQVGMFIGLTFGLTWLLNLGLFLNGGLTSPSVNLVVITQMLVPAFSAILLETFFLSESKIYFKTNHSKVRWFSYYFMAYAVFGILASFLALLRPSLNGLLAQIFNFLLIFGLVVLLIVRWRGGKTVFSDAGMAFGQFRWWLIFGLGLAAFYTLQSSLNIIFNLGQFVNLAKLLSPEMAAWPPIAVHLLQTVSALLLTPLANLLAFFGEEYGWRGYLQRALTRMGRASGVLLVGVIWGVWHAPLILMGSNYPDQPVLGVFLMILFCIFIGYVLSYSVYKSKGVWAAAYLHGVSNNFLSYIMRMVYLPASTIFSFGVGVYGILVWVIAIGLILLDPVWKEKD